MVVSLRQGETKVELIAKNGQVVYRTRTLTLNQAAAFARCLQGNNRFTGVEIIESDRARGAARWFVTFLPSNEVRQEAMAERQQTAREERAAEQEFTFVLDKDAGRPFCWCHSHTSGEVYEVKEDTCSCPDWLYRGQRAGIRCKHQIALVSAIDRGEIRTF
jgi:hypothetical protein